MSAARSMPSPSPGKNKQQHRTKPGSPSCVSMRLISLPHTLHALLCRVRPRWVWPEAARAVARGIVVGAGGRGILPECPGPVGCIPRLPPEGRIFSEQVSEAGQELPLYLSWGRSRCWGGGLGESLESGGGACRQSPAVRLPQLRGPQCLNLKWGHNGS